jgi:hypothetical protein
MNFRHVALSLTILAATHVASGAIEPVLLEKALETAKDNRCEIKTALTKAPEAQREAMNFLVAYMPEHDLQSLKADYLLSNVAWAFKARQEMPWGKSIPEARFLNDVLPYVSVNERRDNWRQDFFEKFAPLVHGCQTPSEAAQILNRDLYKILDVKYHATKRPKPNQSPYESIEAKYASCTGLSVLLIDACRAVGVPARFVGTARWATKRGNHSWVEIWDDGKWHFTGACEYSSKGLNSVWFLNDASKAKKGERKHAIYATSWQHTGESFPMIWAKNLNYVSAVNVTDIYTGRAEQLLKDGECLVGIQVWERPGGERVVCDISINSDDGKELDRGKSTGAGNDTNHIYEVVLPQADTFTIEYNPQANDAASTQQHTLHTSKEAHQRLDLFLNKR